MGDSFTAGDEYGLLGVFINIEEGQKEELEAELDLLFFPNKEKNPNRYTFIAARPEEGMTKMIYRFKPLLTETEKSHLENGLIRIGVKKFYFEG